jgi:nucleoside-diphosphate-sugar epimerase
MAYAGLAGNPRAFGEDYHATSEEAHIWKDLYLEIGRLISVEPHLIYIPAGILKRAAPNLCSHLYYEKTYAGLYDNSKIRSVVPDFKPAIGLSKGLAGILEWWEREARLVDPAKDKLEDQLVVLHDEFGARCEGLFTL